MRSLIDLNAHLHTHYLIDQFGNNYPKFNFKSYLNGKHFSFSLASENSSHIIPACLPASEKLQIKRWSRCVKRLTE